ncbi:hypothetical protein C8R47DRAFT_1076548 [Mycena vitilis]|nr:hypothetical protein C8R47DRAFT_1076548 [Mycena vitilis]
MYLGRLKSFFTARSCGQCARGKRYRSEHGRARFNRGQTRTKLPDRSTAVPVPTGSGNNDLKPSVNDEPTSLESPTLGELPLGQNDSLMPMREEAFEESLDAVPERLHLRLSSPHGLREGTSVQDPEAATRTTKFPAVIVSLETNVSTSPTPSGTPDTSLNPDNNRELPWICDFIHLRQHPETVYVGKPGSILQLSDTFRHVLLRPPRFGETTFLSTLEQYYDIKGIDRFDELFEYLALASLFAVSIFVYHVAPGLCAFVASEVCVFISKYARELHIADPDQFVDCEITEMFKNLFSTAFLWLHGLGGVRICGRAFDGTNVTWSNFQHLGYLTLDHQGMLRIANDRILPLCSPTATAFSPGFSTCLSLGSQPLMAAVNPDVDADPELLLELFSTILCSQMRRALDKRYCVEPNMHGIFELVMRNTRCEQTSREIDPVVLENISVVEIRNPDWHRVRHLALKTLRGLWRGANPNDGQPSIEALLHARLLQEDEECSMARSYRALDTGEMSLVRSFLEVEQRCS